MKFNASGGYFSAVITRKKDGTREQICHLNKNTLTNNGRDWMHAQVYTNTAAGTRGSGYVALSTDTTTPVAADTTLVGELASNGFTRADATTKTHTGGTNSTLIEHTFTASGTVNLIHKSGMFNAASGVTLTHAANFGTDASLISGDTLKVSWTLNLG